MLAFHLTCYEILSKGRIKGDIDVTSVVLEIICCHVSLFTFVLPDWNFLNAAQKVVKVTE